MNTPSELRSRVDAIRKQDRKAVLMLIQGSDGVRYVPMPLTAGKTSEPG